MTFYRRTLPHLQRDFKPHFVTFVTKNRWILPESVRHLVLACCRHDDGREYQLHVAVIMPDHVHLILTPCINDIQREVVYLKTIMKNIKGASAHAVNRALKRYGCVWQEESFDHVLRSSEQLDAKVSYVLQNPVRSGIVFDFRDYRWLWHRPVESPYEIHIALIPLAQPRRAPLDWADEASAPTQAVKKSKFIYPPQTT